MKFIVLLLCLISFGCSTPKTQIDRDIENIYYKEMGIVPASLAVSNTAEGLRLKELLDNKLSNVENDKLFSDFIHYTSNDAFGKVIIE